ncbi:GNAT family N-acetyltransferase [Streptomyces sp. NPDC051445]|uniref:GNAT family N-acetyltransferase n=1 Tax=Streptomyces sp. NPDC051445 TaxID=3365653 RepID=UPI0037A38D5F
MPRTSLPRLCGHRRHVLRTERIVFYTPVTQLDVIAAMAGASDSEAQRWFGWPDDHIVADARIRQALVDLGPGVDGARVPALVPRRLLTESFEPSAGRVELMIAVRLDDGRYAGGIELTTDTGEIGGWLAPHARGLGLGVELFKAAAMLGHAHVGLQTVRAGHEVANTACARALSGAGFVPAEGPPRYTLPDGREVETHWLHHPAPGPTSHCRGSGLPVPRAAAGRSTGEGL